MALASGLAFLFVGVALVWAAPKGRLPFSVPERPLRIGGAVAIALSLRPFLQAGGAVVGSIEFLICLSFAGSVVALAAPLRPRAAVVGAGCAALLAVALELAR